MDKFWDKNPLKSEVIGRCGADEKTEWPRGTDKSNAKNTHKKQKQTGWFQDDRMSFGWLFLGIPI